ncbi:DUF2628 domain-containing protein [Hansschlegelia zhihuaiae]|uniref:DUF2628 domain-containing protein n=1 Tax=Hansschlegelia zhihuaiae TaxID=405005 RepID=A0A4Q0MB39_9HYPH|nr:DUF2628 domain-containing protein [Hansschlegelia zhihuaiae]RXF70325.1 DUF2628 domain-containing protein [Hansschlegelia zhihuaiae]
MRNWLIYEPPGGARPVLEDAEKFVTVREGFSKAAFFLAPFWLIWRRCWLALALWAVAVALVVVVFHMADLQGGPGIVFLALPSLAVGLESSWIRARALEKRGYALAGSALARTREEAEVAFFQDWLSERPVVQPQQTPRAAYRPEAQGVLGLFPRPGAAG